MKNTIKAALAVLIVLCFIGAILPAIAGDYPEHWGTPYPPTFDGSGRTGAVGGTVTTSVNNTMGLPGAYVAIVNASDPSQEYINGTTDEYGRYQFININASYGHLTPGSAANGSWYMIYANKSPYGYGYSAAFGIDADYSGSTPTNVVIYTKPSKIELYAEKGRVIANGADNIKLTAYVYDQLGHLVADGTQVNFTIGNATNSTYSGFDPLNKAPLGANGSFAWHDVAAEGQYSTTNRTSGGSTNIQFGWAPRGTGGNNTTVYAYINGTDIFATARVYFIAPTADWTGYVTDSFGTGYGGVNVKLHVMGWDDGNKTFYEMYTMNRTTSISEPFTGLFAFSYINLDNAVYGYVDAEAQLTDNITIYGASDNYTMNETRTTIGAIVLEIPAPDSIKVTAQKPTILVGQEKDWITAQLYLNGQPYKRANVGVTFWSDNDSIAYLPKVKTNITDLEGRAMILLTSNETAGTVNVTGEANIVYGFNISDSTMVRVVGWGTVSGLVSDQNRNGIPNANVQLYHVEWNTTLNKWVNTDSVDILDNPQLSNDGRTGPLGIYTFYRVPEDIYNVTAESEGHVYWAIFVLGPRPTGVDAYKDAPESAWPGSDLGTATHNIAIPDYSFVVTTQTPTASPTVSPTKQPTSTASVTPTPGFETLFALAGLLGVAYLIARKEN